MKEKLKYIVMGVVALAILLGIIFIVKSCSGVNHKTPENVVRELIEAGVNGKEKAMKDCYGAKKDTPEELQKEIDAVIKYYQAHDIDKLEIKECDVISEEKTYVYVYVVYHLILGNAQEYPCIGTYLVKKQDDKYYVMPAAEITEEMSQKAATDYAKFMTTDSYKNYSVAYDTFIKKNPGYEEKIAGKLN